jgi:hypothetical protein
MGLIKIENYASDEGICTVLAGAYATNTVGVDSNILSVAAGRVGEIKQDPVGMNCRFNCGLYRGTKRDLDAHIVALSRRRHTLHRRCSPGVLCRGTRQQ